MPAITLDSTVRIHDDAVFRELDGESVILQLQSGTYFGLDPVGTRLWRILEAEGSLRRVSEIALLEFDTTAEVLEQDLIDLVTALEQKALVVVE